MSITIMESNLNMSKQHISDSIHSSSSSRSKNSAGAPTFKLVCGLGDTKAADRIEQDRITAMTFDKEGRFLSVGDNDGRIVVFSFKEDDDFKGMPQLQFFEEIFAFDPEFNSQKCIDIAPRVTALEWLNRGYSGSRPQFLACNEKSIKLIKLKVRDEHFNLRELQASQAGTTLPKSVSSANYCVATNGELAFPKRNGTCAKRIRHFAPKHKTVETYANGHQFHVHSLSASSDGEHFISGDEVGVHLWSMEDPNQCYNVVDIAPKKIEDLLEVITHCEYHPTSSSLFLYSSSKGYFDVCDLRVNPVEKGAFAQRFNCIDSEGSQHHFSDIITSVQYASFAQTNKVERHPYEIASRDFLYIKIWDMRKPNNPLQKYKVADYLDKDIQ